MPSLSPRALTADDLVQLVTMQSSRSNWSPLTVDSTAVELFQPLISASASSYVLPFGSAFATPGPSIAADAAHTATSRIAQAMNFFTSSQPPYLRNAELAPR